MNENTVYVILDVYSDDAYAVTTTEEKARKAIDILTERAVKDIIAEDPKESGINWDTMTAEEKGELEESTKSTFYILPVGLDEMVFDNDDIVTL